jgi:hypothetical protein
MKLNDIKEKFNQREIQPSAGSWEKLSNRLDAENKPTRKPLVIWFSAIAAVIVLGLTVVPALFFNGDVEPIKNQIVIEDDSIEKNIEQKDKTEIISNPVQNLEPSIVDNNKEVIKTEPKSEIINQNPAANQKQKNKTTELAIQEPEANLLETDEIETAVAITTPSVVETQTIDPQLSEADILLNAALNKLSAESANLTTTGVAGNFARPINPQKLLRETEWDLEAKSRNRLENTLLDGLGRLKREAVALIDRKQ